MKRDPKWDPKPGDKIKLKRRVGDAYVEVEELWRDCVCFSEEFGGFSHRNMSLERWRVYVKNGEVVYAAD